VPERHPVLQMLAEFLRELAVLVFVFVPLELYRPDINQHEFRLIVVWTIMIAVASLALGIIIERVRP
jgi:hypothetical protein